jgi:hypothetical protein
MSLAERDALLHQLNIAMNKVCNEVDNIKQKASLSRNPHMKHSLKETDDEQKEVNNIVTYLEESLKSTDNEQIKKKIRLAIKQVKSTINKKSNINV